MIFDSELGFTTASSTINDVSRRNNLIAVVADRVVILNDVTPPSVHITVEANTAQRELLDGSYLSVFDDRGTLLDTCFPEILVDGIPMPTRSNVIALTDDGVVVDVFNSLSVVEAASMQLRVCDISCGVVTPVTWGTFLASLGPNGTCTFSLVEPLQNTGAPELYVSLYRRN